MTDNNKSFNDVVAEIMFSTGLTNSEIAKKLDVPVTTWKSWVSRNSIPRDHFVAVAKVLGVSERTLRKIGVRIGENRKRADKQQKRKSPDVMPIVTVLYDNQIEAFTLQQLTATLRVIENAQKEGVNVDEDFISAVIKKL